MIPIFSDKQGNNDQSEPAGNNDSRVDLSDGEDEWKWRKVMYEREQFVEQNAVRSISLTLAKISIMLHLLCYVYYILD